MFKKLFGLTLLAFCSCGVTDTIKGTIVEDCSGVYIRANNVDWKICNGHKLKPADKGENITLNYKNIDHCKDSSECLIYHPSAKSIYVKKVLR